MALEPAPGPARSRSASLRSLSRGGALFAVCHFLGMGLGFAGTMILARIAERQDIASYFLFLQAITGVGLILQLGLGPATLRFAPVSRGQGGERASALLRRRLLLIQLGIWTAIVPPLAVGWPWIARALDAPELAKASPLLIGAAMLASLGQLMEHYVRAFRLYKVSAPLGHFAPRALIFGGFVALWAMGREGLPWEMLITIYISSQLAVALGYAVALRATTRGETDEPRAAAAPPGIPTILGTSTAMGLRSAAAVLFLSSDLWILSWARSHEEVAVYGVAARVMQIMSALPGMANFLIPQEFAVLHAEGRTQEMERLARSASTLVAMISAVALLGLVFFGRPLLQLAFGEAYMGGWILLLILAVGTLWDTASGTAGFVLQMSGNHMLLLQLTVGMAVLKLPLSIALAKVWGGPGVALATTLALIVFNVAMVAAARRRVGVRTFVYLQPRKWREIVRQVLRRGEERR